MDRRKEWRAAERLLKQGNVDAALEELRKVAGGAVADVVTLNRLGDLLARQGRPDEAISYYAKIARQFEDGGFVPKAIAIHKKILRLDAGQLESAMRLGELYALQKMHGEARKYFLHAANRFLETGELPRARAVFERLVETDPDEPRHRVRLAETHAAEGDRERAVDGLVWVGDRLLANDAGEAEKIYRRAHELLPAAEGPAIGLARCQGAAGRTDEAVRALEALVAGPGASGTAIGELAYLYERAERVEDAIRLLQGAPALEIPAETWRRLFLASLPVSSTERLWQLLDAQTRRADPEREDPRLLALLNALADIEPEGHVPALQRLVELHEAHGQLRQQMRALDSLVRAFKARKMDAEAAAVIQRMKQIAPPDEETRAAREVSATGTLGEPVFQPTSLVQEPPPEAPAETDAPAVPSSRADEEFVSGRLTQAEVLAKYDLVPQALRQLREVIARFPGHVGAQGLRVELLRGVVGQPGLARALADLALAKRGAGDLRGARDSAREAAAREDLPPESRRRLEALSLLGSAVKVSPAATTSPGGPGETKPVVIPAASPPAPLAAAAAPGEEGSGDEVVIDLDGEGGGVKTPAAAVAESEPPRKAGPREPAADLLVEIRRALAAGDLDDARRRVDALCELGYAGPSLGELRREIETAQPGGDAPATVAARPGPRGESRAAGGEAGGAAVSGGEEDEALEEDDDLNAIRAALEQELFDDGEATPIVPEESPNQSMDEILQAFKESVAQEVDADDHRTHYDLGIGYKEMGLLDEAIAEFQLVRDAGALQREACTMLAVCYRDRGETGEAVKWYRAALEGEADETELSRNLRYELAEALLEGGDAEGALRQFLDVQRADPSFRDVGGRVTELENQLQS